MRDRLCCRGRLEVGWAVLKAVLLAGLLLAIAEPLGFLFVFAAGDAWDFGSRVGLTVPYGVALALLGYTLLSEKGSSVERRALMS